MPQTSPDSGAFGLRCLILNCIRKRRGSNGRPFRPTVMARTVAYEFGAGDGRVVRMGSSHAHLPLRRRLDGPTLCPHCWPAVSPTVLRPIGVGSRGIRGRRRSLYRESLTTKPNSTSGCARRVKSVITFLGIPTSANCTALQKYARDALKWPGRNLYCIGKFFGLRAAASSIWASHSSRIC